MPYHEINEEIKSFLDKNRTRHEQLINKLISAPTLTQIIPIVQIQLSIKRLLDTYQYFKQLRDEQQLKEIANIANQFFYYMVDSINENINSFHPAQDLCTVALSNLGVSFIEHHLLSFPPWMDFNWFNQQISHFARVIDIFAR